jgi:uncharacterized protein YqjF (DUF2071 family)
MRPAWHHLLFLHWEVDAALLQSKLPPGLELDTFEGRAYLGLVPFTMTGVRPRGLPHLPLLRNWHEQFHETNLRTYVRHPKFGRGVWFFSLDAASLPAVVVARQWFKLPYFFARMSLQTRYKNGQQILRYASQRRWPQPSSAHCEIEAIVTSEAAPALPDTLEHFLVERYLLYSYSRGQLFAGRVRHKPYPLQSSQVLSLQESIISAAGFTCPDMAPLAHYARRVQVDIYGLQKIG